MKRAEETLIVWGTDGQLGGRGARRAAQLAVASSVLERSENASMAFCGELAGHKRSAAAKLQLAAQRH